MLEVQQLTVSRGDQPLLENFNLCLSAGEVAVIRGANGSGKTSLLRALASLYPVSAGAIFWEGRRVARRDPDYLRAIAYLGHHLGLKPQLTVLENLLLSFPEYAAPAQTLLAEVGLAGYPHRLTRELSAGQRQRLAIARVLLSARSLWLLDEPSNALDGSGVALLEKIINNHVISGGIVVMTTHQAINLGDLPTKHVIL